MKTTFMLTALLIVWWSAANTYAMPEEAPGVPPDAPPGQLMPPPDAPPPPPPPLPPPGSPDGTAGHPRRGPHDAPPLQHVREWLQRKDPAELARLEQLHKDNPEAFRAEMRTCLRTFAEETHPAMKEHFARQRAARQELRIMAEQYRTSTNSAERAALAQHLREKLTCMFEARQELRKKELEQLAKRIEELNQAVQTRELNKDALIEEQLKAITEGRRPAHW